MLSALRSSITGFAILGCASMIGCSTQVPGNTIESKVTEERHSANFSLNTPLETIAADRNGKAILNRDLPGLMASPSYQLVDDMSLSQIATVSGGQLDMTKLELVQADLAKLHGSKP